ncbi:MAG: 2-succinyl-5-enolpyruvyl-6-hydroxy-3-cyclohexene-1-carboxylic-acid synthase [Flavobacteriales bacterium]|jgi:2-succinyl-5-enolpyruvyl-6-hydroxy-3-cyclohexene-1-carboxylate synthase|nr:2-succinyl-5-enolpyruvyl-6-hydroxy-3-cyclohexene-1-carboxylic-acid synthase [Flavobacteriales bacterium]
MSTSDHFTAAELARLCASKGVRHAVISPGSRSAPLVIAFSQQPDIECVQVIDERSAGFIALGMAQQLQAPVALICTSGSAVLNYGPAISEAFYQRIPLLVITADRPEEWVDQGEGQAIRQRGVLALHMRNSLHLPRRCDDELGRWHAGRVINEAINTTLVPVPGPVHLNVPFEEPLYGSAAHPEPATRSIHQVLTESFILPEQARWLIHQLSTSTRVLILAGQGVWSRGLAEQLQALARLPQCVVLTESTANLHAASFIAHIDRVLPAIPQPGSSVQGKADPGTFAPDLLITFGGAVVSKRIKSLLRHWRPAQHWHVDAGQRHYDTYQSLTHDIAVDPEVFFAQLATHVKPNESVYAAAWEHIDRHTTMLHHQFVAAAPWCDLTALARIMGRIPAGSVVHLANSTPARYAQLFERGEGQHHFSNRGTSGIDGCTSTAVGAAAVSQRPQTLITGDIAFLYDSNAFWNSLRPTNLRVIVMDNGGGNIFRYIPGPDKDPALLPWFEAPHGRDPLVLAKSLGLRCLEASDMASLSPALEDLYSNEDGPAVLVVRTPAALSAQVLRDYFTSLAQ